MYGDILVVPGGMEVGQALSGQRPGMLLDILTKHRTVFFLVFLAKNYLDINNHAHEPQ